MTDKTALITGCSSGIGRASAEAFLDDGWTVYATSRDTSDIEDLAEQGCRTASLDVTSDEDVERVVDDIGAREGGVDCLVNNAGFGQYGAMEDIPVDRLHHQFDVNVYGPHRLARAVLPNMRRKEKGTIINVSSVQGRISTPGAGPYAGSKFALEAMSDALRNEVADLGINVVLVEPGPVDTQFNARVDRELSGIDRLREYEWIYEGIEDGNILAGSMPFAVPPEEVATVIHDAASVSDPAPRYPVGPFAQYALYARFLPDTLRDFGFAVARRLL